MMRWGGEGAKTSPCHIITSRIIHHLSHLSLTTHHTHITHHSISRPVEFYTRSGQGVEFAALPSNMVVPEESMRRIVHISDLHFGRVNPALLKPLLESIVALQPSVVVVSGDLTQR